MSCHNPMRSSDVRCWPITHGGKKVSQPFVFKITEQYINNWEASRLFLQCIIFLVVDVLSSGCGQIYNIFFDDNRYDVTIGNFLKHSCVYFVKMLASSLGGHGPYV
jgi:hypothetical protein